VLQSLAVSRPRLQVVMYLELSIADVRDALERSTSGVVIKGYDETPRDCRLFRILRGSWRSDRQREKGLLASPHLQAKVFGEVRKWCFIHVQEEVRHRPVGGDELQR
jgi:hypothetical protein